MEPNEAPDGQLATPASGFASNSSLDESLFAAIVAVELGSEDPQPLMTTSTAAASGNPYVVRMSHRRPASGQGVSPRRATQRHTFNSLGRHAHSDCEKVVKLGRTRGDILIIDTLSPDKDSLPTGITRNVIPNSWLVPSGNKPDGTT
jgi:hypothetical protein